MGYQIVRLIDKPEMKEKMANWFSEKWSVPLQAYLDSMEDCLSRTKPIPQWYVAVEDSRIIGGLGVLSIHSLHQLPSHFLCFPQLTSCLFHPILASAF